MSEPKSACGLIKEWVDANDSVLSMDGHSVIDLVLHLESWAAEREAGLRAELDRAFDAIELREAQADEACAGAEALRVALERIRDEPRCWPKQIARDALLGAAKGENDV